MILSAFETDLKPAADLVCLAGKAIDIAKNDVRKRLQAYV